MAPPAVRGRGRTPPRRVLRVRNRNANLLTEAQAIEYGFTIGLGRQAKAELGILPIISGAFGAFRTRAVRAVGPYLD